MEKNTIKDKLKAGLEKRILKKNTGILIKCTTTNRFLLLKRGFNPYKGFWSLISGGIDPNEDSLTAIKREIYEETKINPSIIKIIFVDTEKTENNVFDYYIGTVKEEVTPVLDVENTDFMWVSKDELPTPLYPNIEIKINNFK